MSKDPAKYDSLLSPQPEAGTAPGVSHFRSFSASGAFSQPAYLALRTNLAGVRDHFASAVLAAWATGDRVSAQSPSQIFPSLPEPLVEAKAESLVPGLAGARHLVEATSGTTSVESEEGVGNTCTPLLPTEETSSRRVRSRLCDQRDVTDSIAS